MMTDDQQVIYFEWDPTSYLWTIITFGWIIMDSYILTTPYNFYSLWVFLLTDTIASIIFFICMYWSGMCLIIGRSAMQGTLLDKFTEKINSLQGLQSFYCLVLFVISYCLVIVMNLLYAVTIIFDNKYNIELEPLQIFLIAKFWYQIGLWIIIIICRITI